MSTLGGVVRSGIGRRRVQAVVIMLASLITATATVLAGSLLIASSAPFDRSFTEQNGAHLTAQFASAAATESQLSATASASGVTGSEGPFRTVTATPVPQGGRGPGMPAMTVVGRADPSNATVDRVKLTEGRWATGPGEIVISADGGLRLRAGLVLTFPDLPGSPSFTVVGIARSVSRTADAWVAPASIDTLSTADRPSGYQMLYRLAAASSAADIDAGRDAVMSSLSQEALLGTQSWLNTKATSEQTTALFVPFLVAFGLLGLIMAVLTVGNVVSGAVGAATHRIGVLKAIGFTPKQVVWAYIGQALIPASLGIGIGVVAGNLLTVPVLVETEDLYGTTISGVNVGYDIVVVVATLAVVILTGWAAAWRGGRLRTVDALAVGRAPAAGRGRLAARLSAVLPLPRPVSLGLAQPFARPIRTVAMVAIVGFGSASVTLGIGLASSMAEVQEARTHDKAPVAISALRQEGPRPEGPPEITADPAAVVAAVSAQPGTKGYYGLGETKAAIVGTSGSFDVMYFTGDATIGGFVMTEGRWFSGAGEAVVPTPLLTATGSRIGDSITLDVKGSLVSVRLVGEVFSTENQGMQIFTDLGTFAALSFKPFQYRVALTPGTDVTTYVDALSPSLKPLGLTPHANNQDEESEILIIINSLTAMLTVMLIAVAGLGILNAVVLQTRERIRELGIHKALGMVPRQAVTMVISSVVVAGIVGGAIGVPAGMAIHDTMVPAMGDNAGLTLPRVVLDIWHPELLVLLAFGGLAIAVAGSLLPAGWAARIRTATALRTE
ncbi:MAG TPA: FtsX-like permease family protein [Candidatus Limnocylindrales bacterium]